MPETALSAYAKRLRRGVPATFVWPTLEILFAEADEISVKEGDEFLQDLTTTNAPRTWWVWGPGGSGKTTLATSLAAELNAAGRPALALGAHQLSIAAGRISGHDSVSIIRTLLREARPKEIEAERLWTSRAKHGKIAIIVDGINEVERIEDSRALSLLETILFGRHLFPVVGTSRTPPTSMQIDAPGRAFIPVSINAFSKVHQDKFFTLLGLDPEDPARRLASAGLKEAASSPLILALAARLIGDNAQLPGTRADLYLATLGHPERAFTRGDRELLERPPGVAALASIGATISVVTADGTFTRSEMDDLQWRAWKNRDANHRSDLFIACYLVQPDGERGGR